MVVEKGVQYLTARKLSEASGCSIGTIYNQFTSMDEFIAEENEQTLNELYINLCHFKNYPKGYSNINQYASCFRDFVISYRPLWGLFCNFHFNIKNYKLTIGYRRQIVRLQNLLTPDLKIMFPALDIRRLKLSQKVLMESLMALSALPENKKNDVRSALLLNTYLAGMLMLNGD